MYYLEGDLEFKFEKERDAKKAAFFLGKSDLLFALAIDYPGLYKIPMCYLDAARKEIKRLGLKHVKDWRTKKGYRVFYLGPRPNPMRYGTPKYMATSWKFFFVGLYDEIMASVAAR
jgi:hypothetical protein